MNHYVYMITNNINNMKYIGKRSCKCKIEDDPYMGGGTKLKEDKEKFGIENFSKKILALAFNEAMAFELENYYIKKADAVESEEYYNETYGGTGSSMFYHEDLERRKRVRQILAEKNKGTNAGEDSKVAKKIICLTTGQVFISSAEASKFANLNRSSVNRVCRPDYYTRFAGKHPKTGERLEWMYYDEYLAIQNGEKFEFNPKSTQHRKSGAKAVICLNTLEKFDSMLEASRKYNIKHSSYISQCCLHNKEYVGIDPLTGEKLKWMYYDKYLALKEGKEDTTSNEGVVIDDNVVKPEDTSSNNESDTSDLTQILCKTTGKTFNSTEEASKFYGVAEGAIERCCLGRRSFAGLDPKTGEKLTWEYLNI